MNYYCLDDSDIKMPFLHPVHVVDTITSEMMNRALIICF